MLLDPSDVVLVELPTYSGAIAAFRNLQATLVGIEQDGEGLSIDALDEAVMRLRNQGRVVRVVYVTPNFQNPTGLLMSAARRRALLDAAERHDLLIVEDDPYGTLYFEDTTHVDETRPIKADDTTDRVVYLGSFSKILAPGFRVAWLVAPRPIAEGVELAKQAADLCSGVFDQRIVHAALEQGVIEALAPRLRRHYQEKRSVMEEALIASFGGRARWVKPRGGFFLWVKFEDHVDDRDLFERAIEQHVSFVVGSAFFVNGEGHQYVRLAFSAATPDRIREGIRRLASAVELMTSAASRS